MTASYEHLPENGLDPSDSHVRHSIKPAFLYATPGPLRERLCGLTLARVKTATFDIVEDDEPAPVPGKRWIMLGSDNSELAILETVEVHEMRLADVPWSLAEAEGESFVDLAHWRRAHESFWASIGYPVTDNTQVRCERIRVIEELPGAVGARYPVLEVVIDEAELEWVSGLLSEFDTIGIEEVRDGSTTNGTPIRDGQVLLRAGFASDQAAAEAEQELDGPWQRRFEVLIGNDWLDAWRESFAPVEIGRLLIWPAWTVPAPQPAPGQVVVPFDPGRAWGTGGHESTKLALTLLQTINLDEWRVFDAGCGSGILGVAAALLGAALVDGVDIDMASPAIAAANADRAGVSDRVRVSTTPIEAWANNHMHTYDGIVANILAPVLIEIAPQLLRLRRQSAPVILAGLIGSQVERVAEAYSPLRIINRVNDGEWVGLLLQT
jgi:ribosomal protein L11 methyltransferase